MDSNFSKENQHKTVITISKDSQQFADYAFLLGYTQWLAGILDKKLFSHSPAATSGGASLFLIFSKYTSNLLFSKWGGFLLFTLFSISIISSINPLLHYGSISIQEGYRQGFIVVLNNPPLALCFPFLFYVLLAVPVLVCMVLAEVPAVRETIKNRSSPDVFLQRGYNSPLRSAAQLDRVFKGYLIAALLLMIISMVCSTFVSFGDSAAQLVFLEHQSVQQTISAAQELGLDVDISPDDSLAEAMDKFRKGYFKRGEALRQALERALEDTSREDGGGEPKT